MREIDESENLLTYSKTQDYNSNRRSQSRRKQRHALIRMKLHLKVMAALILVPFLVRAPTSVAKKIVVPQKVADLVIPILDLMSQARQEHFRDQSEGSAFWRSSVLLGRLFDNQGPAADEALVVLFSYYLGESNGEDLLQTVTERGRRMLPILRKYQCCTVQIPGRTYSSSILLPHSTRISFFQEAAGVIEEGKTPDDN